MLRLRLATSFEPVTLRRLTPNLVTFNSLLSACDGAGPICGCTFPVNSSTEAAHMGILYHVRSCVCPFHAVSGDWQRSIEVLTDLKFATLEPARGSV